MVICQTHLTYKDYPDKTKIITELRSISQQVILLSTQTATGVDPTALNALRSKDKLCGRQESLNTVSNLPVDR